MTTIEYDLNVSGGLMPVRLSLYSSISINLIQVFLNFCFN